MGHYVYVLVTRRTGSGQATGVEESGSAAEVGKGFLLGMHT